MLRKKINKFKRKMPTWLKIFIFFNKINKIEKFMESKNVFINLEKLQNL